MDFLTKYNTNQFQRTTTTFTRISNPIASASRIDLGGAFILLSAQAAGATGRLRLYANESSMITDANRAQGDFVLNDSVALITDIVLTDTNKLMFDPPVIGNTFTGGQLWYNLSGSSGTNTTVELVSYPIRPIGESNVGNPTLSITGTSVPTTGNGVSGSITTSKSFLILSGSSTVESRLRLYSRPYTEIPTAEQSRAFGTEPSDNSLLIADLVFDTAAFQYPLVPLLEGYSWTSADYAVGSGEIGYILENRSGGTSNVTVSLYIYSTED